MLSDDRVSSAESLIHFILKTVYKLLLLYESYTLLTVTHFVTRNMLFLASYEKVIRKHISYIMLLFRKQRSLLSISWFLKRSIRSSQTRILKINLSSLVRLDLVLCSLERIPDSDRTPTIVSTIPTPEKCPDLESSGEVVVWFGVVQRSHRVVIRSRP